MASGPFVPATKVPLKQVSRRDGWDRQRRLAKAKAFLARKLAGGPQAANTLLQAAKTAKIATRMLHRAKDELGVRTTHTGWHGQWVWQPPAAAPTAQLAIVEL